MSVYLGNSQVGVNAIYTTDAIVQAVADRIYPIGSIYMSVNSANPSTYLGGTWIAWGSGRVPVGVDPNDTSFDTVEETGGEKEHILLTSEMPSHSHGTGDSIRTAFSIFKGESGVTGTWTINRTSGSYYALLSTGGYDSLGSRASTSSIGNDTAHNNLQPYITCYMWKRTA